MGGSLSGLGVLVTRPAEQADGLCAAIRAAGGEPVAFPAMEIRPAAEPGVADRFGDALETFDLVVFTSANAVHHGLAPVLERRAWPGAVRVAAIGAATARALAALGRAPDLVPEGGYTSEALLALPALRDVRGRRIALVRGEGGRTLLAETLRARGAEVEPVAVYRRCLPDADPAPVLAAFARGAIQAVTVSSQEGLENLLTLLGPDARARLAAVPVVVPSPRVAHAAGALGLSPLVADDATDAATVAALTRWAAGR